MTSIQDLKVTSPDPSTNKLFSEELTKNVDAELSKKIHWSSQEKEKIKKIIGTGIPEDLRNLSDSLIKTIIMYFDVDPEIKLLDECKLGTHITRSKMDSCIHELVKTGFHFKTVTRMQEFIDKFENYRNTGVTFSQYCELSQLKPDDEDEKKKYFIRGICYLFT